MYVRISNVKSEGDSPSSCRAESTPSLPTVTVDGPSEVSQNVPSDEVSAQSERLFDENPVGSVLKKEMVLLNYSDDPGCEEVEDIYDNPEDEHDEQFCVADVRKRLTAHLNTPKKMFKRDPEDPSGSSLNNNVHFL